MKLIRVSFAELLPVYVPLRVAYGREQMLRRTEHPRARKWQRKLELDEIMHGRV